MLDPKQDPDPESDPDLESDAKQLIPGYLMCAKTKDQIEQRRMKYQYTVGC